MDKNNLKPMTSAEIRAFIAKQRWVFAKTYANKAPHEYIIKPKFEGTDEELFRFVRTIEIFGQEMWYFRNGNKYLYIDGRYYWTMSTRRIGNGEYEFNYDDPTLVINRSNAREYCISIKWKGLTE